MHHQTNKENILKAELHQPANDYVGDFAAIRTRDWNNFKFIDLFAGIGGIRLGFESVGGKSVFASEWDALAQETYEANFGERPFGDITQIAPEDVTDHDVLLGGFPCQPFSVIGNRKGFADTRGTLFFCIEKILQVKAPAAFLLENVKQFKTHDGGRTYQTVIDRLTELGYFTHTMILNALDFGVPQKRERTFIAGFKANLEFQFPKPMKNIASLENIFERDEDVDPSLIASQMIQKKRLERLQRQQREPFYPSMWHENKGGHIGIHPYSCALRANASYNYLLVNGRRRPTGREMLRLQGFPDDFKIVVPHSAIRAQAGNSVAVPVIKAIAAQMKKALLAAKQVATDQVNLFDELTIETK
ncbi:MAG: DNA (cytosine-5-)-methyltransferase [Rhizobacter sp.]|nr:DNA (cytosine-5-)-methyltransferase [Chlorobiales bacterium]